MTIDPAIASLITVYSKKYLVPERLIKAFIQQESSWIGWRTRFEPKWEYFVECQAHATKLGMSLASEQSAQATSWGHMQVMGSVARELGFTDYLPKLCLPENGILYGVKKISKLQDKYTELPDIIASYNEGYPARAADGTYRNQGYVDNVLANFETFA